MGDGGSVIATTEGPVAEGRAPEAALDALLADHLSETGSLPVICAGLSPASRAWPVPAVPPAEAERLPVEDARMDLRMLPGLRQADPPDLMQAQALRIAGFLAGTPKFDGVLCLPGAQGAWAHVSAGEIVSFRTVLTGELAELLRDRSSLSPALAVGGWNDEVFAETLRDTMSRPQGAAPALSGIAAAHALGDQAEGGAEARMTGLLLGLELASARPYWLGQRVVVIGTGALADRYEAALKGEGAFPERADGEEMALAGFRAAMQA